MRLEKVSQLATVGCFILGIPSLILAYLAYRNSSSPPSIPQQVTMLNPPTGFRGVVIVPTLADRLLPFAVGLLSLFLIFAGILIFLLLRRAKKTEHNAAIVDIPIFTPLQIEAFKLSKDLRTYLRERPNPIAPASLVHTPDPMLASIQWTQQNVFPWREQLKAGYYRRFQSQIKDVILEFGEVGKRNANLEHWNKDLGAKSEEAIREVSAALSILALSLDE